MPKGTHTFKKGLGCNVCQNSGYFGRIGIFEVILFDEEIKENIMQEQAVAPLGQLLRKKNFTTLRQNGIEMVAKGLTTLEEIIRVLGY